MEFETHAYSAARRYVLHVSEVSILQKIFMYEVIFVYVLISTFSYCQAHICEFLWPDIHIFRKLTSLILF
jgi:hypothetical protein